MSGFAAVVLAGGAARRMGGVDKPALPVGGRPMLARVLAAVVGAEPRIVVGPVPVGLPAGVRVTRERPAGAGPVAAIAAGLALVDPDVEMVAVLAADLPLITAEALAALRETLRGRPAADGALFRDENGRRQLLCGVWRTAALRSAAQRVLAEPVTAEPVAVEPGVAEPIAAEPIAAEPFAAEPAEVVGLRSDPPPPRPGRGVPVRTLLDGLTIEELSWPHAGPPPWFDCDTDVDLRRAQEWTP